MPKHNTNTDGAQRTVLHLPLAQMSTVIAESVRNALAAHRVYLPEHLPREIGNNATSALREIDENSENTEPMSIESPWLAYAGGVR